jgi:hypothetical protein
VSHGRYERARRGSSNGCSQTEVVVVDKARNDLSSAVSKLCLALETHRRMADGRVRTPDEMVTAFFRHNDKDATDRVFKYLPNDVRGPIVAAWGIRGAKTALRDDDERIRSVVADALVAGDIDPEAFEDGLTAEILVSWLPLAELWAFWRGGKLTKPAILKCMETAFDLGLFDARWFLETLKAKNGVRKGTDVIADGLSKDELAQWVHRIHESGDGSPRGIVGAIGWERIVTKTANDALLLVLDALSVKVGLVPASVRDAASKLELVLSGSESSHQGEATEEARAGDKSNIEDWSIPPSVAARIPTPPSTEDNIAVVVDDDLIVGDITDANDAVPTPAPPGHGGAAVPEPPGSLPRFEMDDGK